MKPKKTYTTCVLALSFGAGENQGITNQAIARLAVNRREPIIAQEEIALVLRANHGRNVFETIQQQPGEYLDSYKFLKRAKEIIDKHGFTNVILLGHQDHLPRIKKITEKMGMNIVETVNHHLPYDHNSTQWWTRNKFLFCSREIITMIHHRLKGWI